MLRGNVLRYARAFHGCAAFRKAQLLDMPAMSPTMTEGGIVQWAFEPGASFSAGDVLLDIETDKAQISVEAQDDGVLATILKENGAKEIPVGSPIAVLCDPDDDPSSIDVGALIKEQEAKNAAKGQGSGAAEKESAPATESAPASSSSSSSAPRDAAVDPSAKSSSKPVSALPAAIRLAHANNISLDSIKGTGPHGRILKGDVLAALGKIPESAPVSIKKEIEKLQHLDLSYEKAPAAPAAAPQKPVTPPPVKIEVDISLDTIKGDLYTAVARAERLAVRDSILAAKPKPSVLRSSALDKLCEPKNKVPYKHRVEVLRTRGRPVLVHAVAEYEQGSGAEKRAHVFIEGVQRYLA